MKLKIGILGCRGIPNRYGGFEQCAEELSTRLADKGHDVYVYNSSLHPYRKNSWKNVHIIHCTDWEDKLGAAGQFIYDWNCITDSRKRNFDIVLQLGYTSSSIWWWRWPKNATHIVNMDGLEWKRTQYSKPVRRFLKNAEALAAKHADFLVADSRGIQAYILNAYIRASTFIPYGAERLDEPDPSLLAQFSLQPYNYHIVVSRLEPENNIEMIIKGYLESRMDQDLVIVGTVNQLGKHLKYKYPNDRIKFIGPIYDKTLLNNLRYFSLLHFHGHSVGGTNPSLLEAMACKANIAAHNNVFNRAVLGADAEYFNTSDDITRIINAHPLSQTVETRKQKNLQKINDIYNWDTITDAYEQLMMDAIGLKRTELIVSEARQIA
ncbi:MAG: DUF1972 domain-containing protein [Flavisolibacter sp.]